MLDAAGVASPRVDAELLAAHLLGVERRRLGLVPLVDPSRDRGLPRDGGRSARKRIPVAAHHRHVADGRDRRRRRARACSSRGPRPNCCWAGRSHFSKAADAGLRSCSICARARARSRWPSPHARPDAVVHAVELEPRGAGLGAAQRRRPCERRATRRSCCTRATSPTAICCRRSRALSTWSCPTRRTSPKGPRSQPEVAEHDPHSALFGGPDGLSVIKPMISNIARWLRIGGAAAVEHDDTNGDARRRAVRRRRVFGDVVEHPDLAGTPPFRCRAPVRRRKRVVRQPSSAW